MIILHAVFIKLKDGRALGIRLPVLFSLDALNGSHVNEIFPLASHTDERNIIDNF